MAKFSFLFCSIFIGFVKSENNGTWFKFSMAEMVNNFQEFMVETYLGDYEDVMCKQHLAMILPAVGDKNIWAQSMLDSEAAIESGLALGRRMLLGRFDECLTQSYAAPDFDRQYCIVRLTIPKLQNFYPKILDNDYLSTLLWGICVPSTCSAEYLTRLANSFQLTWTNEPLSNYVTFNISQNDCISFDIEDNTDNLINASILLSLCLLSLLCSFCVAIIKERREPPEWLTPLSVMKNLSALIKQKKTHAYEMGLATLGTFWAISTTVSRSTYNSPVINTIDWYQSMANPEFLFFNNSERGEDMLLFLAGLIVVRKFYKFYNGNGYDHVMAVIKKYIIWTVPLGLCLVYAIFLMPNIGSGPVWSIEMDWLLSPCEKNWPYTISYVQNYLNDTQQCLRQTWLFDVEMQLFVLSPILLFPIIWNFPLSIFLTFFTILATTILEFYIAYDNDLGPTYNFTKESSHLLLDYYKTYTRATPWLVGCFCGQIIAYTRRHNLQISRKTMIIGWLACLLLTGTSLFSLLAFDRNYTQPTASITLSGNRLAWALALAWIAFTCETNNSGTISNLLSWGPMSFLGRLTWPIYAVHEIITHHKKGLIKDPRHVTVSDVMSDIGIIYLISVAIAFYLMLFVQYPTKRMVDYILKNRKVFPVVKKQKLNEIECDVIDSSKELPIDKV